MPETATEPIVLEPFLPDSIDLDSASFAPPSAEEAETLVDWLDRAALFPGTGLRFVDRRGTASMHEWSAIRAAALGVAGSLVALGVEPGERVALVYPTDPEFFHAFFGILLAGAVPAPLYPPVRLGKLDEYHRRTAAMLLAASARWVLAHARVRGLLGETVLQATESGVDTRCLKLSELPQAVDIVLPQRGPDDLALVQFSSGTTVDPKPVALSHRALLAQTRGLNALLPDGDDVVHTGVSWLPLYHDMGLVGCIFPALARPSTMTLLAPESFVMRPAAWLRAISETGATISVAPNFAYALCVDRVRDEEMEGVDLSQWRIALNGAEPVAPSVLRAFQHRFARWGFRPEALTPVYGLSEASLAVTFSALDEPFPTLFVDRESLADGVAEVAPTAIEADAEDSDRWVEIPSVGRPLPDTVVAVRGEEGLPLPEQRVGRVWAKGPALMDGYLDRPEATAAALRDGWLDTGDLGFLFRGELFLTGRAKDVVILRGRNYAPSDIEQAVDGVAGVRTGCAVAVSHRPASSEGGAGAGGTRAAATEELVLFVEHARDVDLDAERETLETGCRDAVLAATGLSVDRVILLAPGTLPRTSSGKLRRAETLRRHLGDELSAPARVSLPLLARAYGASAWAFLRARWRRLKKPSAPDDA